MKPVDQTKVLERGQRGNCLAACLASILELPLASIPEFEELPPGHWKAELASWSAAQGFRLDFVKPENFTPGECYIAVGLSTRGNLHATVGLDGAVIHDPHHLRLGLAEVKYLMVKTADTKTMSIPA
jgi:hypothetical protein